MRLAPAAAGSGTLIRPDGTILTSFYNIADAESGRPFDLTLVQMSARPSEVPVPVCYARPVRALTDRQADLALVQCEEDLTGRPLGPRTDYPWSPLRRKEVGPGEILVMMGYTLEHGGALRQEVTRARSSGGGKGPDIRGPDARGPDIGVNIPVSAGMSGGAAFDLKGSVAGVPVLTTGRPTSVSSSRGVIRRNSRVRALLDRAQRKGWSPARWRYRPVSRPSHRPGGSASPSAVQGSDRAVHPGRQKQSFLSGRMVSSQTGYPVAGGVFVVLKNRARWGRVDNLNFGRNVRTWAVSDAAGYFQTISPLPRGPRYQVGILARGFKPVRVSGLVVPVGAGVVHPLGNLRLYPPK